MSPTTIIENTIELINISITALKSQINYLDAKLACIIDLYYRFIFLAKYIVTIYESEISLPLLIILDSPKDIQYIQILLNTIHVQNYSNFQVCFTNYNYFLLFI